MITRLFRNHTQSATDGIALGMIALVLLYNGTLDVPNLSPVDQRWLVITCVVGGALSLVLSVLCLSRRIGSPSGLEAAMAVGLIAATLANFVTGDLWPDSLWITCGYTMTISVAAGVTLRNPTAFLGMLFLLLVAWLLAVELHSDEFNSRGDATTLVVIGGIIAVAVFWILRIEREAQASLTRQLRRQLDHDALTGVLNRTGLMAGLDRLREDASGRGPFWCAYLDVNYFKTINDRKGHDYGDEVLRAIARGLIETCGDSCLVSRWGGDEFVVVANGAPPADQELERQVGHSLDRDALNATVTVGVMASDWSGRTDPEALIKQADLRMYRRRDSSRAATPGQIEIEIDPDPPPPSI